VQNRFSVGLSEIIGLAQSIYVFSIGSKTLLLAAEFLNLNYKISKLSQRKRKNMSYLSAAIAEYFVHSTVYA
jgi:hypothetical protein